ncbi:MAG: branched-chain-amino-acid transaminase [Bacteriovoracaceae bacterium]
MENIIINLNGEIFTNQEAKISVLDRGFLYGDSVYEVIRTYNGIPFLLDDHLKRLWHSASKIGLEIDHSPEQITQEINKTLAELEDDNAYIRVVVTRGEGPITLDPTTSEKNNLVVIVKPLPPNPKEWYSKGVSVIIANVLRVDRQAVDPNIKSGNYLNNIMAVREAKNQGAFDAIMLNNDGFVTEGSTHNIWMVKNNTLYTPPLKAGILEGITRKAVLLLASQNKIPIEQKNITPNELINADEAFLTATTKEIVPITEIDNSYVKDGTPGQVTRKLMVIYQNYIKQLTSL